MSQKNIELLHRNKIIYNRDPVNDKPTKKYSWGAFYENGTYEYYSLFHSKSLITTYKSLKWHLLVLRYLNEPFITDEKFKEIAYHISNYKNGFTNFKIASTTLDNIIEEVKQTDLKTPPKNKLRKVIFKMGSGLTVQEKLQITGSLIGRSKNLCEDDIYDVMVHINDKNEKITVKKIANELKVTPRTIYRYMNKELKQEKMILNKNLIHLNV